MTYQEKISIKQKGRKLIHKGDEEKRVTLEELDSYLRCGWELGFSQKHLNARKQSMLNKYGSLFPNNKMDEEHRKKIGQSNSGKPNKFKGKKRPKQVGENISKAKKGHIVTQSTKDKISKTKKGKHLSEEKLNQKLSKEYKTKKKNNSFNTSNDEKEMLKTLKETYKGKTIKTQYKDKERYPFYCDFYIEEEDLFIELNAHWSHGGHPFDPNSEEDLKTLKEWEAKAKTSQFYKNAIETWTIRDVKKQEYARKNKLNYKVIY